MPKFRIEVLKNVKSLVKELSVGLRTLNFEDNFTSFEVTVALPAATEVTIRNQLTTIPSGYIIKKKSNGSEVADGTTVWDANFLYLKNYDGTNATTITVVFLK